MEDNLPNKEQIIAKIQSVLSEFLLSPFQMNMAVIFLTSKIKEEGMERLRKWLLNAVNNVESERNQFQFNCPEIVPGLSENPFYDPSQFDFIDKILLEKESIVKELLSLRENTGFQPYKSNGRNDEQADDGVGFKAHEGGDWNVFYLYLHEIEFTENIKKCPITASLIEKNVPRQYKHAFFSALTAKTRVKPHCGPTNKKLRLHIPLLNCEDASFRAGDKTIKVKQFEPFVFDDSFEHEAWNDSEKTRIHLIIDFWHPLLSHGEVKFFDMLLKSKLKKGRKALQALAKEKNYFQIIEESRNTLKNNDWWVG